MDALRVVIVTQEDPIYVSEFFNELVRLQQNARFDGIEFVAAMIQAPLGTRTRRALFDRVSGLYGFFGTMRIGFTYVWHRITRQTVAGAFGRAGIPILQGTDANAHEFVRFIEKNAVDLVVSVSASQIFKESVLGAPRFGCINLHNAPLPMYRGMLPNFWQMYHGERRTVLTIHEMVRDLDRGDILLQRGTPIEPGMTLHGLMRRTKRSSANALADLLRGYLSATVKATPLPDDPGSYFTFPTRDDVVEFRRRGYRVL